jgi:hypothetical protein
MSHVTDYSSCPRVGSDCNCSGAVGNVDAVKVEALTGSDKLTATVSIVE